MAASSTPVDAGGGQLVDVRFFGRPFLRRGPAMAATVDALDPMVDHVRGKTDDARPSWHPVPALLPMVVLLDPWNPTLRRLAEEILNGLGPAGCWEHR